jgi:four helix bundle protein
MAEKGKGKGKRERGKGKTGREIVGFARVVAEHGYIFRRLAGQLVDAGGSVGANLEESADAQTKPDFISKQFIALKEARETRFWLRLIAVTEPAFAPQRLR